jgi:hypothetical protein
MSTNPNQQRICYGCKWFVLTLADPGYSEFTPGNDWAMSCSKDHWRFDPYTDYTDKFAQCLDTAQICPDYAERKGLHS